MCCYQESHAEPVRSCSAYNITSTGRALALHCIHHSCHPYTFSKPCHSLTHSFFCFCFGLILSGVPGPTSETSSRSFLLSSWWTAIMSSTQDVRVRLSYDVYNSTSISPRFFLQGRVTDLAWAVFALVNDEALDYSQLLDFTAEFQSLVEHHKHAADARRHRESKNISACFRQARLTQFHSKQHVLPELWRS